jgi:hypothetical protein
MLGMTKRAFSQILKEIFKVRFRGAGKFKVSEVSAVNTAIDCEIYSFNLKCEFKREPYTINYLLKFYLGNDSEKQAQKEFDIIKEIGMDKQYPSRDYHLDISRTRFKNPFIIINKDDTERVEYLLDKSKENS